MARWYSGFRCLYESRLAGSFVGYGPGIVFVLDNGDVWEQLSDRSECVYQERPACWLYTDGERYYLDIGATSGVIEVRRLRARGAWPSGAAYQPPRA